jgi:hypothetical protein
VSNTPMLANWDGQDFKIHTNWSQQFYFFNYKIFPFFMQLKHVQSLALDFKFYITQRFDILIRWTTC